MKRILIKIIYSISFIRPSVSFFPIQLSREQLQPTQLSASDGEINYDPVTSDLRQAKRLYSCAANLNFDETSTPMDEFQRRSFLRRSLQTLTFLGVQASTANARGLARFPCKEPLLNTYHFMRAGTSLLEEENVWSTNPLFLTNREAALSNLGEMQVKNACKYLAEAGIVPTVVRYSLAAASIDSANIVGEELRVSLMLTVIQDVLCN
jgi:hypothetical protein